MTKLEKVIQALEHCQTGICPESCEYFKDECFQAIAKDALELLKEQEAQRDYEAQSDMRDYCERYEPTYNPDDGSM